MKCKVCNNELIPGTRQCPYCGALVPVKDNTFGSEFKWNVQDFPKPKKDKGVSIDWNSGRIRDNESGRVYDQTMNGWAEPEEIRDLFTFDTKNEKRQMALDREMDKIAGSTSSSGRRKKETGDMFHLPASMNLRPAEDLAVKHPELFEGILDDVLSAPVTDPEPVSPSDSVQTPDAAPMRKAKKRSEWPDIFADSPAPAPETTQTSQAENSRSSGSATAAAPFSPAPSVGRKKEKDLTAPPTFDFRSFDDALKKEKTQSGTPKKADTFTDDFVRSLHSISGDIYGKKPAKPAWENKNKAETTFDPWHMEDKGNKKDSIFSETSPKKTIPEEKPMSAEKPVFRAEPLKTEKADIPFSFSKPSAEPEMRFSPAELPSESDDIIADIPDIRIADTDIAKTKEAAAPETEAGTPVITEETAASDSAEQFTILSDDDFDNEFSGFNKLIEAEKKFRDGMEKVSFLSPSEYEEAERAETHSQKLRFVPTISFRTIEDEYESYRRDNGLYDSEDSGEKGVHIRINEPSGTKVTVKTQEVHLASLNNDEKVRTREVVMNAVKQPAKNVQVSVEISAAQGNASVEVTRRPDGATVVKTLDKSDTSHLYVDGQDMTDYSDLEIPSKPAVSENAPAVSVSVPAVSENAPETPSENVPKTEPEIVSDLRVEIPAAADVPEEILTVKDTPEEIPADTVSDIENPSAAAPSRDFDPDQVADGSTSSEAAQQTVQVPAPEAEIQAAAFAARKAAEETAERVEQQNIPLEFWERPAGVKKMTITDIFGPDAYKIIEEGITAADTGFKEEDTKQYQETPQAAVPSPEQEESVFAAPEAEETPAESGTAPAEEIIASDAMSQEEPSGEKISGNSAKQKDDFSDSMILTIKPEDIAASRFQTDSITIPSFDPSVSERGVTTDTISQERQEEIENALNEIEKIKDSERKKRQKAEKKAQKAREKAERAQRKAGKRDSRDDDDEDDSLSPVTKALITILLVLLLIEFAVIGIKLFAPDSGAAVLFQRLESQITGIFSSDDSTVYALDSSDLSYGLNDAGETPGSGETSGEAGVSPVPGVENPAEGELSAPNI